jgi:CRISPR/Cas system-associated endonuclease Cas3-HD
LSFQTEINTREKSIQREVSELNESIMDKSSASSALLSRDSAMTTNLQNFESKYKLGEGAFGKVFLVQNKINSELNKQDGSKKKLPEFFAMKVIEKNKING